MTKQADKVTALMRSEVDLSVLKPAYSYPEHDTCLRCGCTSYQAVCSICQDELELLAVKENRKKVNE